MKILLDENLDWRLERHLPEHDVSSVPRIGWAGMRNGKLLEAAAAQFDVLITMDGSIPHQQECQNMRLSSLDSARARIDLPTQRHLCAKFLPSFQPLTPDR